MNLCHLCPHGNLNVRRSGERKRGREGGREEGRQGRVGKAGNQIAEEKDWE